MAKKGYWTTPGRKTLVSHLTPDDGPKGAGGSPPGRRFDGRQVLADAWRQPFAVR